jgi:hypothetical protein
LVPRPLQIFDSEKLLLRGSFSGSRFVFFGTATSSNTSDPSGPVSSS